MAEICVHFCTQLTGLLWLETDIFGVDVYFGRCQLAMHNKHRMEGVQIEEVWEILEWISAGDRIW